MLGVVMAVGTACGPEDAIEPVLDQAEAEATALPTAGGGSIHKAYTRYAAFILGERASPQASEGPPKDYR
ncbi:hypothetical protein D7Y21_26090 [Corallococcus sp. AB045]|nr:hypothetical protein D7Y21_26090 [Corallococcus sp. AB045]